MNHSATVLQQEARLCPLARRWHCVAAARVGPATGLPPCNHLTPLQGRRQTPTQQSKRRECRHLWGGRGQTECGSEDNLPRAAGFRKGKGRQGGAQTPSQQGQAPSAQPSEGVLHLFGGRSHRSGGRDIYHPVPGRPEPLERTENQTPILGPRRRSRLLTVSQAAVSTAPLQRTQLWLNTGSTERLRSAPVGPA